MTQRKPIPITAVKSVSDERDAVNEEQFVRRAFEQIRPSPDVQLARQLCLQMLMEQREDVKVLAAALGKSGDDSPTAIGIALAGIKKSLTKDEYEAYLCDSLVPRWGTDHGLRHSLRTFGYSRDIMQLVQKGDPLPHSALHRLAWMAMFHDIAYTIKESRSHAIYSAGFAEAILRMLIMGKRMPQSCPLELEDIQYIANGIWGHDKRLKGTDPLYDDNILAKAVRDADLLAPYIHFDVILRIAKMNLFFWEEWNLFDTSVGVQRRLDILNTGASAHTVDAVLDFVKNLFWKPEGYFLPESRRIASSSSMTSGALVHRIQALMDWAQDLGVSHDRLEKTGVVSGNMSLIQDCVEYLYSHRPTGL